MSWFTAIGLGLLAGVAVMAVLVYTEGGGDDK